MSRLEQRVKRLEVKAAPMACNHHFAVILENPTEEQIELKQTELSNCPNRQGHKVGLKLIIIRHNVHD